MVLYKLYTGVEVRSVELVRNVPAERAKLPSLLYHGVHEGDTVQHGLPLRHVGDVEEVLRDARVCTLQSRLHTLGRLIGEFDGDLPGKVRSEFM